MSIKQITGILDGENCLPKNTYKRVVSCLLKLELHLDVVNVHEVNHLISSVKEAKNECLLNIIVTCKQKSIFITAYCLHCISARRPPTKMKLLLYWVSNKHKLKQTKEDIPQQSTFYSNIKKKINVQGRWVFQSLAADIGNNNYYHMVSFYYC